MTLIYQRKKKTPFLTYLPVFLLLVVLGVFIGFSDSFARTNLEHEKQVLQTAIQRSITQCYALEGIYPYDLAYLEDHYGLTYNKEHFFIAYQYIGSNLRPDVTIIERD